MIGLTIQDWLELYAGADTPETVLLRSGQPASAADPAWIHVSTTAEIQTQLDELAARLTATGGDRDQLPLYGVPFAVKDNIDVAGLPTTAGCPEFAYTPETTAPAVTRLQAAGAILIGKTNLDQFATGLVGTRSPHGPVPNSFNPEYICGGSSSGSAAVVARGLVAFALGTDTAGSGRVPAGFNNIVGLKPTRGAVSSRGLVPACRSLDCVSTLTLTVDDAQRVYNVLAHFDEQDPFSRPARNITPAPRDAEGLRLGVPAHPCWFGDDRAAAAFARAVTAWVELGADIRPLDFSPLHDMAALLYEGPWIAERYAAVGDFLETHPGAVHPVVAELIGRGRDLSAVDVFRAQHRLAELQRIGDRLIAGVDALLVPTTPTIYKIAQVQANPIELNSRLGTYTNFVNLMDCCALALPAGLRDDGLPFGITLIAPAWHDTALVALGRRWQVQHGWLLGTGDRRAPVPAPEPAEPAAGMLRLAVVGAHLRDMPLNYQLTERGGLFVEQTTTADDYRLFALAGAAPPKPGLIRADGGAAIQVELWDLPVQAVGSFVASIPAPLGIGTLVLADGREVKGFICEGWAADSARDITAFGGWRAFVADQEAAING